MLFIKSQKSAYTLCIDDSRWSFKNIYIFYKYVFISVLSVTMNHCFLFFYYLRTSRLYPLPRICLHHRLRFPALPAVFKHGCWGLHFPAHMHLTAPCHLIIHSLNLFSAPYLTINFPLLHCEAFVIALVQMFLSLCSLPWLSGFLVFATILEILFVPYLILACLLGFWFLPSVLDCLPKLLISLNSLNSLPQ